MSGDPTDSICLPPDLPPYLKDVHNLQPILGVPTDEEVIGIHAVIRMASKVVDVRYRKNYLATVFPQDTIFTPPTLHVHVAVQLEPVAGTPSDEEIIKVQQATRSYHQFVNVPSIFDPKVDMELSQHLFNIQMSRYTQHARRSHTTAVLHQTLPLGSTETVEGSTDLGRKSSHTGNNAGTGASVTDSYRPAEPRLEVGIHDALERSNRLAEQANQLIERSNQISERTNLLIERTTQPEQQTNKPAESFNKLFERMNQHLEESNRLAAKSMQPVEKLGDVLGNINRVLMKIQHAIIRSYKGNNTYALDCLVNEKGETPGVSHITKNATFCDFSTAPSNDELWVIIGGKSQNVHFDYEFLEHFLRFYGIENGFCDGASHSKEDMLSDYLSSCLG
ncbi:unnamed protein product [Rhizoctonia solani]|uniref:Laminin domain protein n=1 Tax=Rhizoctonia solani TaxID=456999 RepID=A0A8H3AP74_9AGAM|nr:unnamed protein product [Rhizoctonia solani]